MNHCGLRIQTTLIELFHWKHEIFFNTNDVISGHTVK